MTAAKLTPADCLFVWCDGLQIPRPEREHKFYAPVRDWAFDFAWLEPKIAFELEGGTWLKGGGRHNRGAGFENDCRKYAMAVILGWRVIRATTKQFQSGEALAWLERILRQGT